MKRILILVISLVFAATIWICLTKQNHHFNEPIIKSTNAHLSSLASSGLTNVSIETNPWQTNSLLNATQATNLWQWKLAITNLQRLGGFTTEQHWLAEQPSRKVGLPVTLSQGNQTVLFQTVLISVTAKNGNGQLIEVDMQSQDMDIDETRKLGLKLCSMLGYDTADFIAWCDKVGNHWLDAPLYSKGNHYYGFQTLMTYNDKKPWMINVLIMHP